MACITTQWILFLLLLVIVHSAQAQESYEPDSIPYTPSKPTNPNRWSNRWANGWTNGWMDGSASSTGGGSGTRKRYDRFNNWMKILQEFVAEGNWLQGGPDNLMEYLTKYLTKLLDILLRREGGSGTFIPQSPPVQPQPPTESSESDDPIESEDSTRISSGGIRNTGGNNMLFGRNKINLNDLLKSIPINELNFNP